MLTLSEIEHIKKDILYMKENMSKLCIEQHEDIIDMYLDRIANYKKILKDTYIKARIKELGMRLVR